MAGLTEEDRLKWVDVMAEMFRETLKKAYTGHTPSEIDMIVDEARDKMHLEVTKEQMRG